MAASEDCWKEKQYWKTERDGQIQELPGIVTKTVASAKRREVDTGQVNEGKPGIEQVIDDLARQTAEQRELLNALSETWRKDNQRQHEELINAVRATANEQVPCNLQGYLAEFSQAILGEVGELREERRAIQHEVGLLLTMRAKYSPGGEFYGDWQAMGGDPLPDVPPQPQAAARSTVNHQTTKRIQKQKSVQRPEAEAEIPPSRHTQSWATWHPNPTLVPTPPSVEPRLLVLDCQSPGSPGPWQTMGGGLSSDAPPRQTQSWATWFPNPAMAPTPPPVEPTLVVSDRQSPGLFGPRSPRSPFR
ncbi:hypothetical protein BKA83DRAFT_4297790 [Pisolithus microcarpus]|nr:hypothetical protein BKA83DRAFT_4297790 [Pisolithus microcarpus]